jgi:hypothetical protein
MELAPILERHRDKILLNPSLQKSTTFKEQRQALNAIISCRNAGNEIQVYCPAYDEISWYYHSCGHRNCPRCQNHETARWIDRQRRKLLPVDYFLVTFTLPAELRPVARRYPKIIYDLMFALASKTVMEAMGNSKRLGGLIGLTGVLHTNNRRLDYHPHIHFIVPGVALLQDKGLCVQTRKRFLVYGQVLGRLFRGKFIAGLKELGIRFPRVPDQKDWVVDCKYSGKGDSTLKYLSRYLYRGVISEKNILSHENGEVTFQYANSTTKQTETRKLPGEAFSRLVLQHTLPKGFRRVRDFGFLHGNSKKKLWKLQLLLIPKIGAHLLIKRPVFKCCHCGKSAIILAVGVCRSILERNRSPPTANAQVIAM